MEYFNKFNTYLIYIGNNFKEFLFKYRYILLLSFVIGLLINSVDIFTFKFGIDCESVPYEHQYKNGRYGSLILFWLFPFLTNQIISQLIGLIALIFASLLMVSKYQFSNTIKLIFIITIISSIYIPELQYFFFQSSYNFIGFLFCVIAFRLIENNKNIIYHILAIILLFIGITSYQSNISVYLSTLMICIILDFINNKEIKASIYKIIKAAVILLITLLIYYIVIKLLTGEINKYHANFISWLYPNADYKYIIRNLIKFIFKNEIWSIFFLIVSVLYAVFEFKNIKERTFFILLSFLFILSVFAFHILMGNEMQMRTRTQLAILPAFLFLLLYTFKNNFLFKILVITLCIFNFFINIEKNIQFHTAYKVTYEQDKITASKIFDLIYTKYPEIYNNKYYITFYGKLTYNNHIFRQSNPGSFFNWDNGNPLRMYMLLRILGLPDNIMMSGMIDHNYNLYNTPDEVKDIINKMPAYPHPDCVYLYKDTVIVKLSN